MRTRPSKSQLLSWERAYNAKTSGIETRKIAEEQGVSINTILRRIYRYEKYLQSKGYDIRDIKWNRVATLE